MKKTTGVKESFERNQQSQIRLFEQFNSRNIVERNEESIEDCETISIDRRNGRFQSGGASIYSKSKIMKIPQESLGSSATLQADPSSSFPFSAQPQSNVSTSHQQSKFPFNAKQQQNQTQGQQVKQQQQNQLDPTQNPQITSNLSLLNLQKKKWKEQTSKNAVGMASIIGDNDSLSSRIDIESKQFSHLNDSKILNNKREFASSLMVASPALEEGEVSKKSSNQIQLNQGNSERSPMMKSLARRGSRRLPGSQMLILNQLKDTTTVNAGAQSQNQTQPTKAAFNGGFFLAMKMKKYGKHLVSRLQSRRYLGLRAKHMKFFNDKTIMPDREKGVFMATTTQHNNNNMDPEELTDSDFVNEKSISNQCLLFLRSFYLKNISSKMKKTISKIPIIQPSHNLKLLWDFLNMICITYFLIFFPLKIAFGMELYTNPLPSIGLFIIILDIIVFLNTGFFDKGTLVTDRIGILLHYIKQRAFYDGISLLPFIIFDISESDDNLFSDSLKVLDSLISIMFLVRLTHLSQIKKKIEERFYQKKTLTHIFSLFTLLLNTLFIAHIFACIWIVIAKFKFSTQDTWMHQAKVQDEGWTVMYLYSLYFLIITMTTVGYGDIRPQNDIEHLVMIIIVLISSVVFSFSINSIGTIVKQIAQEKEKIKETLQVINNYMNKKSINMNLQQQIREYLEYYLKELLINDNEMEEKIFEMLSEPLNRQLMIEANKIALKDSPIFRNNFSEVTISKTVQIIDELRCTPEEVIFYEGELDNPAIFFVQQGKVELFIHSEKSTGEIEVTSLKVFSKGSSFGEMSFFTGSTRSISIRSIDFTTLLIIKRSDFLNVVKEQPEDYENFCKIRDNILFYKKFEDLGIKCISCNSINHFLNDCPFIHYVPDQEKIIKIYQRPIASEREKFDRSRMIRSRCLEDFRQIQESVNYFVHFNIEFIEEQDWYDGDAEDEEEYEFYNQYEDEDDDDDNHDNQRAEELKMQRQLEEQLRPSDLSANDLNNPNNPFPRHFPSSSNVDGNNNNNYPTSHNIPSHNNFNVHSTYKEDSYAKQSSMIQTHVYAPPKQQKDEYHSSYQVENVSVKSSHFPQSGGTIGGGLRGSNALDVDGEYRGRASSNLGINDLAVTPSGLILNLINPNPGNIREPSYTNKPSNMMRKKSASNSNLHNPTQLLGKSHTLNADEIQAAQQSMPSPFGLMGFPSNSNNNFVQQAFPGSSPNANAPQMVNSATLNIVSRNNSLRKSSKRKNTEKTLRSTHRRKSTKRTIDSRMNVGIGTNSYQAGGGGNTNIQIERKKVKKLTILRKGIQENQIQNTLLALQGMENILLQSKAAPNSNEFDVMKCYEIYFPHNNIDVVIFQLRKQNPHLYAKQKSFIKSTTKRLHGGATMNSQHNRMSKMDIVLQKFLMSEFEEERDNQSLNSNNRLKSFTQNTHKTPKTSYALADHYSRYRDKSERKHSYNQAEHEQKAEVSSPIPLRKKSKSMRVHTNTYKQSYPQEDNFVMVSHEQVDHSSKHRDYEMEGLNLNQSKPDKQQSTQKELIVQNSLLTSGMSSHIHIIQNERVNGSGVFTPQKNVSFQDQLDHSNLEI